MFFRLITLRKSSLVCFLMLALVTACTEDTKQRAEEQADSPAVSALPATARPDTVIAPDTSLQPSADSISTQLQIQANLPDTAKADARARYLAGLPARITDGDTNHLSLRDSLYWQQHANRTNIAWQRFRRHQGQVSVWAKDALIGPQAEKTVFYPFSGPDFAHVFTLFPQAETYTMVGLEPVGTLPALEAYSPSLQRKAFKRLTKSLSSILNASFFITKDMDTVLRGQELRGTAPILQFFMVRMGCTILGYDLLKLNAEGQLVSRPAVGNDAIRIRLRAPNGNLKQLVYIAGNLNDYGLKSQNPGLMVYIKALPDHVTYLKSASYLLHSPNFTAIRWLLLTQSSYILQDDSGIPFKYLGTTGWQTTLYGNYIGTIRLFSHKAQPDMLKAYQDTAAAGHARPLNFRLGYGKQQQINLQLARRIKS